MTQYLKEYMEYVEKRLRECGDAETLADILNEHKDKIAFMQHERLVHFLVTMMFAIILVLFIGIELITDGGVMMLLLIIIIIVLVAAYIKHYYFLENTVQQMYRIYDRILKKQREFAMGENAAEKARDEKKND